MPEAGLTPPIRRSKPSFNMQASITSSSVASLCPSGTHKALDCQGKPAPASDGTPGTTYEDNVHRPVPAHLRRGPFTMGLLWITMCTGLPCVIMGFEWHRTGMSLIQVLTSTVLSSLVLLAYLIPAAWLGARSGRSFISLSK